MSPIFTNSLYMAVRAFISSYFFYETRLFYILVSCYFFFFFSFSYKDTLCFSDIKVSYNISYNKSSVMIDRSLC